MEEIRSAIEKASGYLAENPDAATGTDAAATAVREEGLRFRVEGPKGSLTTDMAESVGGGATGPTPAWLLRAALASCDASLVAMEAARDGVELTDLTVTVESETDFRGILGVNDGAHPGPSAIRTRIELAAPDVTEDQLREIVRRAEERSPVRDAVVREVSMTTEIVTAQQEIADPAPTRAQAG
jgi:uncharacterized OsmC-like protein